MSASLLPDDITSLARRVVEENRAAGRKIVVAESCTGGMLASLLTDVKGMAHAFDRGFVNHELERCKRHVLPESRWVDTLQLAQKRFPGMYNSLDALCKRFKISLATRDKHGATL